VTALSDTACLAQASLSYEREGNHGGCGNHECHYRRGDDIETVMLIGSIAEFNATLVMQLVDEGKWI